ncbi:MAG: CHASE domain-containing protein, partial [Vicinamibacterales bacterium]
VVDRLLDSVQARVDAYIDMLNAAAGLFAATPVDDPETFRRFANSIALPRRYPGVQGIGFTRRMRPDEVARIETEQRHAGVSSFRVWPADPRREYHAILYLEPLDRRNRAAIGYDMFTEPVRREAMIRARDTGRAAASGPVTLVQEIDADKQHGFLIYVPIYQGGTVPPTVEAKRDQLVGFVYSPFRAGDLFQGILGRNPRSRAWFELYDGSPSPRALLHRTEGSVDPTAISTTETLNVAGRRWTAQFFSTRVLEDTSSLALVPLIAWVGALLTILFAGAAWRQTRAQQRAEASEAAAEAASVQLRAQAATLESESRVKDEFLATLSHELRTPLNAIIGWAHMLSGGRLTPEKQRHAAEVVLRNARMQASLISDLLDMSRIVSGRAHIDLVRLDLRDVMESALTVVRPTAVAKQIELTATLPETACLVRGDSNRLHQVLWNLLTNAIKFTPSGGRVAAAVAHHGATVSITVVDTGVGMTPEFIPLAFERFRQADGSSARRHGGLGLGLSIVRGLVALHGGTVTAASPGLNRGATFTVVLPAATPESTAVQSHTTPPPANRSALQGQRVLVVDDEVDARQLTSEILTQHGATVVAAGSGSEALARLQTDGADINLVVCDIAMPGLDGYETIRRLRELPLRRCQALPALALTAFASPDDRMRALRAGYTRHLAKPFDPDELVVTCARTIDDTPARCGEVAAGLPLHEADASRGPV